MFCFKAFQILVPRFARLLSPKVADLRAFTKVSLDLTLAFSFGLFGEDILFMKLGVRSLIVLNISKAKFYVFFNPIDGFWLSFGSV